MANKKMSLKFALTLIFSVTFCSAFAQQSFSGPSDATSPAPTLASAVQKIVNTTGVINLNTAAVSGNTYQWFKKDATGKMQLVQQGPNNTYTETPSGKGYYTYQLVVGNASGCTSTASDPYIVFVLPTWTASITSTSSTVCEQGHSTAILTALPTTDENAAYTYQWTRNGINIDGATNNTYTVSETSAGNVSYGVTVTSSLSKTSVATASQTINVIPVPSKPSVVAGL